MFIRDEVPYTALMQRTSREWSAHDLEDLMLKLNDHEEKTLVARLTALQATEEETYLFRLAWRHLGEKNGKTVADAYAWADAMIRRCLDHGLLGLGLAVIEDPTPRSQ
jgi:hypothetical protein